MSKKSKKKVEGSEVSVSADVEVASPPRGSTPWGELRKSLSSNVMESVIEHLNEGPMTVSDLASSIKCSVASTKTALLKLAQSGKVTAHLESTGAKGLPKMKFSAV